MNGIVVRIDNRLIFTHLFILLASVTFAQPGAYTPNLGSPERQAIMDTMRLDFYRDDADAAHANAKGVLFKVLFLKVHDGWACVHVDPVDSNGKRVAEPRWALLRQKSGTWRDLKYFDALRPFASDEEAERALEMTSFTIEKIRARFPSAPADIFPAL